MDLFVSPELQAGVNKRVGPDLRFIQYNNQCLAWSIEF